MIEKIDYICKTKRISNSEERKLYSPIIRKNIYGVLVRLDRTIKEVWKIARANWEIFFRVWLDTYTHCPTLAYTEKYLKEFLEDIPEWLSVRNSDYINELVFEIWDEIEKINSKQIDKKELEEAQDSNYYNAQWLLHNYHREEKIPYMNPALHEDYLRDVILKQK